MSLAKLKVLIWKNWVLQKKRPFSSILQFLWPIITVVISAWLKNSFQVQYEFYSSRFERNFKLSDFTACNRPLKRILYSPNKAPLDRLIEESFKNYLFDIEGYENGSLLREALFSTSKIQSVAIAFKGDSRVSY